MHETRVHHHVQSNTCCKHFTAKYLYNYDFLKLLHTQFVALGVWSTVNGPISSKFPNPVEDPPGPPCVKREDNEQK